MRSSAESIVILQPGENNKKNMIFREKAVKNEVKKKEEKNARKTKC